MCVSMCVCVCRLMEGNFGGVLTKPNVFPSRLLYIPVGLPPKEQSMMKGKCSVVVSCALLCREMLCHAFSSLFHSGDLCYLSKSHYRCVLAGGIASLSTHRHFDSAERASLCSFSRWVPGSPAGGPLTAWGSCRPSVLAGVGRPGQPALGSQPASQLLMWGDKKPVSNPLSPLHNENHCDPCIYLRKILLLSNLCNNTIDSRFV